MTVAVTVTQTLTLTLTRLSEATSLLSAPGVSLDAAGLRDALLLIPQTEAIGEAAALALVAAAARTLPRSAFVSRH